MNKNTSIFNARVCRDGQHKTYEMTGDKAEVLCSLLGTNEGLSNYEHSKSDAFLLASYVYDLQRSNGMEIQIKPEIYDGEIYYRYFLVSEIDFPE